MIDPAGEIRDTLITPPGALTENQKFLRVTEFQYNPATVDTEFIELANISRDGVATTLDLGGVSITEGPSSPYVFPAGTTLASGDRLLVVENRDAMLAAYPSLDPALIVGEYAGQLSNGGERINVGGWTRGKLADHG